jgi:glycosyltransferase involved in cell wall biosynthesis
LARHRPELDFQVRAAGYLGEGDRPYLDKVLAQVARGPLAGRFEYVGELDRQQKIHFLQSLSIFALPTVYRESKGLPVLEAMANGVPVVLPRHGSFPEIVADTEGGLLHEPLNTSDLASILIELVDNPDLRSSLGAAGRRAIVDRYHSDRMADETVTLYEQLVARPLRAGC